MGVSFVNDRFGNHASACYLFGNIHSYLNLGTGSNLKPSSGSISVWVKMMVENYSGEGYQCNPIILTKCHSGDDFFEAYCISYGLDNKQIATAVGQYPSAQVNIFLNDVFTINKWHNIVITYDDNALEMYYDGEFVNRAVKKMHTAFLDGDSVMVGYSANKKNNRFFNGIVDDICIYNRVLSPQEVSDIYHAPDPNRWHIILKWVLVVFIVILLLFFIAALLNRRIKKELEKEREKNILQNHLNDMEMKVIKAQMNPHFIFNSMIAIQQFILAGENERANTYLVKFSRLIRKILESNTEDYITLDTEIDILNRYLEIESLRFGHSFQFLIVSHESANEQIKIPQMMIQPFVENAIWHGLLPKPDFKEINIEFKKINAKTLQCIIKDNGVGRTAPKQEVKQHPKKSLGIHFIRQRLAMMSKEMGTEYSITITDNTDENNQPSGTTVLLLIPIL